MNELQWLQNANKVDNARGDTLSEICEEIGIDTTGVGIDRAVQSQEAEQVDDVVAKVDAAWDSLDTAVGRAVDLDRNTIAAFRVAGVSGKRFLGQATITSITMDDTLTFDTEQGESFSGDITEFYFE
jgi:hypothetical protein